MYDNLSEAELENVVSSLEKKLESLKAALAAKTSVAAAAPALKAKKAEGSWPELPW